MAKGGRIWQRVFRWFSRRFDPPVPSVPVGGDIRLRAVGPYRLSEQRARKLGTLRYTVRKGGASTALPRSFQPDRLAPKVGEAIKWLGCRGQFAEDADAEPILTIVPTATLAGEEIRVVIDVEWKESGRSVQKLATAASALPTAGDAPFDPLVDQAFVNSAIEAAVLALVERPSAAE